MHVMKNIRSKWPVCVFVKCWSLSRSSSVLASSEVNFIHKKSVRRNWNWNQHRIHIQPSIKPSLWSFFPRCTADVGAVTRSMGILWYDFRGITHGNEQQRNHKIRKWIGRWKLYTRSVIERFEKDFNEWMNEVPAEYFPRQRWISYLV